MGVACLKRKNGLEGKYLLFALDGSDRLFDL